MTYPKLSSLLVLEHHSATAHFPKIIPGWHDIPPLDSQTSANRWSQFSIYRCVEIPNTSQQFSHSCVLPAARLVLRLLNLAGVRLITIVRPFPQGLPGSPGQVSGRLPFLESVCSALLLQAWSTRLVRTHTHHCGHLKLLKAQLSCALCDKVLSSCNLEQMFILWFLKHCFSYSSWKEVFSFANTFLCRPQINNSIRLINISFVQTKNYIDPTWYIAFCGSSSTRDQSLTGLANRTF